MVIDTEFTTGPATLPDVGELSYNGCIFSPLFETKITGTAVKDNALRTVKYMEYTLTADGYVTLSTGATSTSATMAKIRKLLTVQGGALTYTGRGNDIVINSGSPVGGAGKNVRDVCWGPIPEILEFQTLGAGNAAKIQWQCKFRIPEVSAQSENPLLQFNYEVGVIYGEDGYSSISVKGTLEIPLGYESTINRKLTRGVDDYRKRIEDNLMSSIDLTRFRVIRREFVISRDKRTLDWQFELEELAPMDPPPFCTIARGTFSARPAKSGMGLVNWLCTLRATYTVRKDQAQRTAWFAFLLLLRLRMKEAELGNIAGLDSVIQNPAIPSAATTLVGRQAASWATSTGIPLWVETFKATPGAKTGGGKKKNVFLLDFSFDEGMYNDSRTTSFSASWRLVTTFSNILLATGLWKQLPKHDKKGDHILVISMRDISGVSSWLPNKVDPTLDIVVDFGSQ